MAKKTGDISGTYDEIGTGKAESVPGSDLAPGIGTRISAAANALGSRKNAADVMGVSSDSLQRYIREEAQPTFAAVARLALASGRSMHWIATGQELEAQGPEAASQPLSEQHLMVAHELADEALSGLWLPRHLYYQLVGLAYAGVLKGLPYATILSFAREEATDLAKERTEDDSEQGVGRAGTGGDGGSEARSASGGGKR